jgi:outer membrane protein OmpA-like peptidoglycan-associated protein
MSHRLLLANLALALLSAPAWSQEVRVYRQNEAVDPQDVARILGPEQGSGIKMRSLRLLDAPSAGQAKAPAAPVQAERATQAGKAEAGEADGAAIADALSLPVQFSFDSAAILPGARGQLDALAEGIRLLPEGKKVVIEGHTDSVGTDAYNNQLSSRRAASVKQYLVAVHHIDAARLKTVGMGKNAPLPGREPDSPENRRVQFRGE